jgi:DNA (cytosine-5)-methyltransferase 1
LIIGLRPQYASAFEMPAEEPRRTTVADALFDLMQSWAGAEEWRKIAVGIAPALVGGSKKHGGPDLAPTRARAAWAALGVDGRGIADHSPTEDFAGYPSFTSP